MRELYEQLTLSLRQRLVLGQAFLELVLGGLHLDQLCVQALFQIVDDQTVLGVSEVVLLERVVSCVLCGLNTQPGLLDRHPLTVVWSSARHGKHMKSRPPLELDGRKAVIRLDGERLERLQRYPGEWKGFFYLDGREVGEAVARVG